LGKGEIQRQGNAGRRRDKKEEKEKNKEEEADAQDLDSGHLDLFRCTITTLKFSPPSVSQKRDSIKSDSVRTKLGHFGQMVVCQQEVLGAFALWVILLYVLIDNHRLSLLTIAKTSVKQELACLSSVCTNAYPPEIFIDLLRKHNNVRQKQWTDSKNSWGTWKPGRVAPFSKKTR